MLEYLAQIGLMFLIIADITGFPVLVNILLSFLLSKYALILLFSDFYVHHYTRWNAVLV